MMVMAVSLGKRTDESCFVFCLGCWKQEAMLALLRDLFVTTKYDVDAMIALAPPA
jgi:hypothetical protein